MYIKGHIISLTSILIFKYPYYYILLDYQHVHWINAIPYNILYMEIQETIKNTIKIKISSEKR